MDEKMVAADVADMSVADIKVALWITGITDRKLKEKLMELKDPTVNAVRDTIRHYERCINDLARMSLDTPRAAAAFSPAQGSQKANNKKQRPMGNGKNAERRKQLEGRCFRCGSDQHSAAGCAGKDTFVCSSCNKRGHLASVCLQKSTPARAQQVAPPQQYQQQQHQLPQQQQPAEQQGQRAIEYSPSHYEQWDGEAARANAMRAPNQQTPPLRL